MPIIGIDPGTSNCAAVILRSGRPVIIPSAEGTSLRGTDMDQWLWNKSPGGSKK